MLKINQGKRCVSTQLNLETVGPHADFAVMGMKDAKIKGNLEVAQKHNFADKMIADKLTAPHGDLSPELINENGPVD